MQLTSTTGQVLWKYDYDAFGVERPIAGQETLGEVVGTEDIVGFHRAAKQTKTRPDTGESVTVLNIEAQAAEDAAHVWTNSMSLIQNTDYTLEFDYWSDNENSLLATDLYPDDLPEHHLTAGPQVKKAKLVFNSDSANMLSANLRFINYSAGRIYVTNVKFYKTPVEGEVREYPNPWRYCGEYYDTETGTVYLRARNYEPLTGRFLTEDTFRGNSNDPLSLNVYTYCGNNPIIYVDPTGHYFIIDDLWNYSGVNTAKMQSDPNWYSIGNWLTLGTFDMISGTFNPKEPLSLQHWLDSLGTATLVLPVMKAISSVKMGAVSSSAGKVANVWNIVDNFERGMAIEKQLGGWCNNFPTIDKAGSIVNGVNSSITSIKSMKLTGSSYQSGNSVYNTIMGYVDSLAKFQSTQRGIYDIKVGTSTQRILELAIPPNATAEQWAQINNAISVANGVGVEIKVITIS